METKADKGISVFDEKYVNFKKWLQAISGRRGLESTLTIVQLFKMLDFLDSAEERIDEILIDAICGRENNEKSEVKE